jgi:hypothetical protein
MRLKTIRVLFLPREAMFCEQEVKKEIEEVKNEVKDVKESVSKLNKDMDEVKVTMSQVLEKLNMLEQLSKPPSLTEGMLKTPREDILIAGGDISYDGSVEIFSWEKNRWFEVSPMNEQHRCASSFNYNDQLFVVGGHGIGTISTLDLNKLPLKWMKYPRELPYKIDDCQTVVYQQRIIHIGGFNCDQRSDMISELELNTSPVTMKKLCQMPGPRVCHGAEIVEDKVMILGGENFHRFLNSVLEFDVKKNKCKEMPPLPHPLSDMATVRWRDKVVVLGGQQTDYGRAVSDAFMYDCKTGKVTAIPSMLEKRFAHCAVITGNTIVIMGGLGGANEDSEEHLSSVEFFTMGVSSKWEYLPAMNESRIVAVAEILPSTRKYV